MARNVSLNKDPNICTRNRLQMHCKYQLWTDFLIVKFAKTQAVQPNLISSSPNVPLAKDIQCSNPGVYKVFIRHCT